MELLKLFPLSRSRVFFSSKTIWFPFKNKLLWPFIKYNRVRNFPKIPLRVKSAIAVKEGTAKCFCGPRNRPRNDSPNLNWNWIGMQRICDPHSGSAIYIVVLWFTYYTTKSLSIISPSSPIDSVMDLRSAKMTCGKHNAPQKASYIGLLLPNPQWYRGQRNQFIVCITNCRIDLSCKFFYLICIASCNPQIKLTAKHIWHPSKHISFNLALEKP